MPAGSPRSSSANHCSPSAPARPLNKVLWVAKDPQQPLSDLKIRARHDGEVLQRTVPGGPGPSTVDLPRGCWELSLSWSGRTDHLNLQYR